MLGLAFVVAGLAAGRFMKELGKPVDWAYEMVFAALVGGSSARGCGGSSRTGPRRTTTCSAACSGSGWWYGGAPAARMRAPVGLAPQLADAADARRRGRPLAAGYAIGRIGCQLAGDGDYGIPWDGPWAMAYPDGTVPTTEEVHPTPVYETIAMGIVALLLWRWRHRWRAGTLFGLWLVLAGAERFLVEFVRRNDDVFLGLTQRRSCCRS